VAENLDAVAAIAEVARRERMRLVIAIGIAMFCPYEGEIPEARVLELIERMRADGVEEFYVATSVGLDAPRKVHGLCSRILDRWPGMTLGLHLHNTNGMALANALAGMDAGVSVFEGSICGIGGGIRMPYGMPHYGNVATEDLAHMFSEMGVDTGVEVRALLEASRRVQELLGLDRTFSHALQGGTKEDVLELGRVAPRDR
jgi:hydroxymethylglutaryl-CoA lyase